MGANSTAISEERKVAEYILKLLEDGRLNPGDRIPAERKLAENTGVSRGYVRGAIQRLELYGIVKTFPQSGTLLTDHTPSVLKNQIRNLLEINSFDFHSLVQVRILLEKEAIRLCALNRTDEDIESIRSALEDFKDNMNGELRDEKDLSFHLTIARASHNPVLSSLLLKITPDVLKYYRNLGACSSSAESVCKEHSDMLECIVKQDEKTAVKCMEDHFKAISSFAEQFCSSTIPRTTI